MRVDKALKNILFGSVDSIQYYQSFIKFANNQIKNDTLVIFSFGSQGYSGRGSGFWDSISLMYDFIYVDASVVCGRSYVLKEAVYKYNEVIYKEIDNRFGKEWTKEFENKIKVLNDEYDISNGYKANVEIKLKGKVISENDTLNRKDLTKLKIKFINEIQIKSNKYNDSIFYECIFIDNRKPLKVSKKLTFTFSNLFEAKPFIKENYTLGNRFLIEFNNKYCMSLGNISIYIK